MSTSNADHRRIVAGLIDEGRSRNRSDLEIAEEILDVMADPTWGKAYGHPVRAQILRLLRDEGPMSPSKASGQLSASLGTVSYHFRVLNGLGVVTEVDQIPRRGAVEHVYALADGHKLG